MWYMQIDRNEQYNVHVKIPQYWGCTHSGLDDLLKFW